MPVYAVARGGRLQMPMDVPPGDEQQRRRRYKLRPLESKDDDPEGVAVDVPADVDDLMEVGGANHADGHGVEQRRSPIGSHHARLFLMFVWKYKFGIPRAAMIVLLRIVALMLQGQIGDSTEDIRTPITWDNIRTALGLRKIEGVQKYAMCGKCFALYPVDRRVPQLCTNVKMPDHKLARFRSQECGNPVTTPVKHRGAIACMRVYYGILLLWDTII